VGGDQDGGPGRGQAGEDRPQVGAALRVESRGRLVEEQDRGPVHQRDGDVEVPAHAARVGPYLPVGRLGQPELLEQLGHAAAQFAAAHPVDLALQRQVLVAGQDGERPAALADRADH
jgi:hypothetical protein